MPIINRVADLHGEITAWRHDIHAHPELLYDVHRTAATVAEKLRSFGCDEVVTGIGRTGVVGVIRGGRGGDGGRVIGLRADMDALPIEEANDVPYKSTVPGKMHACGHDGHTAMLLGAARYLAETRNFAGDAVVIFQPAEEGGGGARAMLADGLFSRFPKPDMGFALHVGPGPYGFVSYRPGVINSTSDSLSVLFTGKGGHGSRPHVTIDPVMMAGHFIVDVQSVISREKDAAKFGVVTIGSVQAGNAGNVIPDTALLRGTIRSYDDDTRAKMIEGVQRTAKAVALMAGAPPPEVKITAGAKAVINDADLAARGGAVLKAAFGDKAVLLPAPGSASEDYSEFIIAGVPSFYFGIGGLDPKAVAQAAATNTPLPGNHSPEFAPVPEPTIRTGTQAMSLVLLDVLQKK